MLYELTCIKNIWIYKQFIVIIWSQKLTDFMIFFIYKQFFKRLDLEYQRRGVQRREK